MPLALGHNLSFSSLNGGFNHVWRCFGGFRLKANKNIKRKNRKELYYTYNIYNEKIESFLKRYIYIYIL